MQLLSKLIPSLNGRPFPLSLLASLKCDLTVGYTLFSMKEGKLLGSSAGWAKCKVLMQCYVLP